MTKAKVSDKIKPTEEDNQESDQFPGQITIDDILAEYTDN